MPTPGASSACVCASPMLEMADLLLRFAAQPRWVRALLLLGLGAVAGLGQAPFDLWFATILALAGLFLISHDAASPGTVARSAWFFGIGYFAVSLRWIVEPFLVDIATHGWMAPFAMALMATGAGAFWMLAGWAAARLAPGNVAVFGLLLAGAEVLRSLIFTGFPWALLGHVWISTGIAQMAAFGGPHLLTLITILAAWAVTLFAGRQRVIGLVVLGLLVAVSFVLAPGPASRPSADLPVVRLIQPNAPQHQKWDPAYRDMFLNRMLGLTGVGPVPDLVVWPETAIPYMLNHIDDDLSLLSSAARAAPLVFGIQRRDAQARAYNSLVVMGPGGQIESIYDKRHLVPFGEYMPGAALLGRAGATGLARNLGTGFTPGAEPGPVTIPGIGDAVPLICYEGIFAEEISHGAVRPRLLLLITNDAWFGRAAGPHQHLAQARLRAIEQGLPMVRVANTGISAMIDAKGRITASIALGMEGAIDTALPPTLTETPYSRWGDLPVILSVILLIVGLAYRWWRDSD